MTPQDIQREEMEFAQDLVGKIICVQRTANKSGNSRLVKEMQELAAGVLYVEEILWAFRRYPKRRQISDVADYLDVTRPGLHHRVKNLGLTTDDFASSDADLRDLVQKKSSVLSRLVSSLESIYLELQEEAVYS